MDLSTKSRYQPLETGEFVISDYNNAKLFSSFFPGIAGKDGIPLWAFYVNRGQCLCSMGVQDKDHPIMEFLPANWAYELVATQGFRTFIKLPDHESMTFYEPFQNHLRDDHIQRTQRMSISPSGLSLEEINQTLGLAFTVQYYTVPQDNYAGLVRSLTIRNHHSESIKIEGLDGLPLIIPYGVKDSDLKHMRRLVEAFVEVVTSGCGASYFRGKVELADRPDVVKIRDGNFYVGFENTQSSVKLVRTIVDPRSIFGSRSDYSYPEPFLVTSLNELGRNQIFENRLPCAMGCIETELPPGETYTYTSIIGHAASINDLNTLIPKITTRSYIETKAQENKGIIDDLMQNSFICSAESTLDHYAAQNFLDNVLRGGIPVTLKGDRADEILHLYSRKHGDLERDYNFFRLTPTHYSQGNGNFRDVNQNRRCDLLFNPDVRESNVELFYNLLQLDGFNPLVIKEIRFEARSMEELDVVLNAHLPSGDVDTVGAIVKKPFTPGELLLLLGDQRISLKTDSERFLGDLLGICSRIQETDHGDGFWTDHWTYNLDLLENYLTVYPEQCRYILFEKKKFSFFDNAHRVRPRNEKYKLWHGKAMQLDAVMFDEEKDSLIRQRRKDGNRVRTEFGDGDIYHTSLIIKILCLLVNKLASLDPEGVGVEMEADKPNWYDALNGLPGLMGSSISETFEIRRHILFLLDQLQEHGVEDESWPVFEELKEFMDVLNDLFTSQLSPFEFWDSASTAKEGYREKTRFGISGKEVPITLEEIREFLAAALRKVDEGIEKAWDRKTGIPFTYFINRVVSYREIECCDQNGENIGERDTERIPCFRALKFEQIPLPLFLEGPVHYLRCSPANEDAKKLAASIRASELFDKTLKMYKVNASLVEQPMEIGRARVFSPGWFENESIWLHMEYKYMLELLRNGLHEEFYRDFRNVCIPFLRPEMYGRSILENSSFIVSSGNPDPSIHGNGFVARLTGATAEFINILQFMTVGRKPFLIDFDGSLELHFTPAMAEWLFTRETRTKRVYMENRWQQVEFPANTFSFMFLGAVLVTYHNESRMDTYGPNGVSPARWTVIDHNGHSETYTGESLRGEIVEKIRNRAIRRIDIELR